MFKEQLTTIKKELFGESNGTKSTSKKKATAKKGKKKQNANNPSGVKKGNKSKNRNNNKSRNVGQRKTKNYKADTTAYPMILDPASKIKLGTENKQEKGPKEVLISLTEFTKSDRTKLHDLLQVTHETPHFSDLLEPLKEINYQDSQELVIGLDFGTAYTKVVIGSEVDAEAIKFNNSDYVLPSNFFTDKLGNCNLYENEGYLINELKMPLLTETASKLDYIAIVCFLALVLKECRAWQESSIFRDVDVDWLVNAGLPTENYHAKNIEGIYRKLVSSAWLASFQKTICVKGCKQAFEIVQSGECESIEDYILHKDCLNLFPEFAAQIVGYVQSPSRREYSHLLVDIGAGTLDIAMFIVSYKKNEWLFETTGKDVQTLGADVLVKHRLHHANCNNIDTSRGVPADTNFAALLGINISQLNRIDRPFISAVSNSLNQVVWSVAAGHQFGADITTFVCGGGNKIALYPKQVEGLKSKYNLQVIPLPKPERLRNIDVGESEYHRLSVAYGLSYDPMNIGKVTRKSVDLKQIIHKRSAKITEQIERNVSEMYK